ncbi:SOS response-associated peptidase family protein [Bdellovibrio bacteriovorus]|nr:SOS response-associated peptidase family protein [Bdellovibrio bacteriovorus]BEV68292.1 hypothetical protein Bb109J_c1712 [Bdellovibrio bacteriovorus]
MCARYGSADEFNLLIRTYHLKLPEVMVLPQEIIYPHTPAPVIVKGREGMGVRMMNYSLIPSWSDVRKPKFATYNARIEEVLNKPSWREPFKSRHCLVPVKFFIESVYEGPYAGHNIAIAAKDQHLLSAAGIWDSWTDRRTGEVVESVAILTGPPPEDVLAAGHDRCPIFLADAHWEEWLSAHKTAQQSVDFLKNTREVIEFSFTEREVLKNHSRQMSLFEDGE